MRLSGGILDRCSRCCVVSCCTRVCSSDFSNCCELSCCCCSCWRCCAGCCDQEPECEADGAAYADCCGCIHCCCCMFSKHSTSAQWSGAMHLCNPRPSFACAVQQPTQLHNAHPHKQVCLFTCRLLSCNSLVHNECCTSRKHTLATDLDAVAVQPTNVSSVFAGLQSAALISA